MSPSVTRVSYKSYSGPRIRGTEDYVLGSPSSHWDRVLWLVSKVESGGRFGAITMYDGTAVTAGLHQAIAVYPKELAHEDYRAKDDQGTLWSLLRSIELIPDFPAVEALWDKLKDAGFYVGRDGVLRYLEEGEVKIGSRKLRYSPGDIVYGTHIRETFTPDGGSPKRGAHWEQSKSWALAFHAVFSDPKSFKAQSEFGMEHFEQVATTRHIGSDLIVDALYDGSLHLPAGSERFSPMYDLALAVFWSHSVNAPAIAYRLLKRAYKLNPPQDDPDKFARRLLRLLGTSKFGRWNFSVKNGRWARTRRSARKVWEKSLFSPSGVMPASL